MNSKTRLFLGSAAASFLTGCIGYQSTLFATKTNIGLDLDTKPPTAEVSIARREVVIAPAFEDGQTPPVAASFRVHQGSGKWIFANIDSTFTGGDAAFIVAKLYGSNTPPTVDFTHDYNSALTLREEPAYKRIKIGKDGTVKKSGRITLPSAGTVRPLVFGTDTSLGVKVAWSGLTAQYPDSVKIGFSRKELAWAPVFGGTTVANDHGVMKTNYSVKMSSFLATMESNVKLGGIKSNDIALQQTFATGRAADYLAIQKPVRAAMTARLDPKANLELHRDEAEPLAQTARDRIDRLQTDDALKRAIQAAKDAGLLPPRSTLASTDAEVRLQLKKAIDATALSGTPEATQNLQDFLTHLP